MISKRDGFSAAGGMYMYTATQQTSHQPVGLDRSRFVDQQPGEPDRVDRCIEARVRARVGPMYEATFLPRNAL